MLTASFREYDRNALRQQAAHRWVVRAAAVVGTLAVVVVIAGLALETELAVIEIVATIFAGAAVVLGLRVAFQREWLLNRYKAERLRALKFAYLIEPATWSTESDVVQNQCARLEEDARQIDAATFADLDRWIERVDILDPPEPPADEPAYAAEVADLVDYYRLKRLGRQAWFYFARTAENDRLDRFTRRVPQYAFFCSVVAALAHFAVRLDVSRPGPQSPLAVSLAPVSLGFNPSTVLVILAATLPLVGSCIRTIRGSREFARNRVRYHALYQMLVHVDQRLRELKSPARLLRELWYDEQALNAEIREWLRLMREAEWYG